MFTKLEDFLANMATLNEETYAAELKKFSATERANINALEYIAADIYPQKHVDRKKILLTLKVGEKLFYPIVGWDPDASHPNSTALIPPMRRWLNGRKISHYHNPKENRTYTLYA